MLDGRLTCERVQLGEIKWIEGVDHRADFARGEENAIQGAGPTFLDRPATAEHIDHAGDVASHLGRDLDTHRSCGVDQIHGAIEPNIIDRANEAPL